MSSNQDESKKTSLKREWDDWGRYTTFHGVPVIFRAPNMILAVFWLILLATSTGLCIYMLYKTFGDYYSYDVVTRIRTIPKRSLPFPQINICNQNFMLDNDFTTQYIKEYFRQNFKIEVNKFSDLLNYFEDEQLLFNEIESLYAQAFVDGLKNETIIQRFGLSMEDFFFV